MESGKDVCDNLDNVHVVEREFLNAVNTVIADNNL